MTTTPNDGRMLSEPTPSPTRGDHVTVNGHGGKPMSLQAYDWALTLAWAADGQAQRSSFFGQVEAPPGTMEDAIRADLLSRALPRVPSAVRSQAVVEDFTLTRDGVGGKFHECPCCWRYIGVELEGPFKGTLVGHVDDETRRRCGGSHAEISGPGRNWHDGRAPRNLPAGRRP